MAALSAKRTKWDEDGDPLPASSVPALHTAVTKNISGAHPAAVLLELVDPCTGRWPYTRRDEFSRADWWQISTSLSPPLLQTEEEDKLASSPAQHT